MFATERKRKPILFFLRKAGTKKDVFENMRVGRKVPYLPDAGDPSSSGCTWRGSPAHAAARTSPRAAAVGTHGTDPCTPVPTSVAPSHGELCTCCFRWCPSAERKCPGPMSLSQIDLGFRKICIAPELPSQALCTGSAQRQVFQGNHSLCLSRDDS